MLHQLICDSFVEEYKICTGKEFDSVLQAQHCWLTSAYLFSGTCAGQASNVGQSLQQLQQLLAAVWWAPLQHLNAAF